MVFVGRLAYRFGGRYYVRCNRRDNSPAGLGADIVKGIPDDPGEFQKWFEDHCAKFCDIEEALLTYVLTIPESFTENLELDLDSSYALEPRYKAYLDDRMSYSPSFVLPIHDELTNWLYTIDLDNELFIVNNEAHFELAKIPRLWKETLIVPFGEKLLNMHSMPKDSIPHRGASCESSSDAILSQVQYRIVRPKRLDSFQERSRAGPIFFGQLWKHHRSELERTLPYTPIHLPPHDFGFREVAFSILSLAAGLNGSVALIDARRVKRPIDIEWRAIVQGDDPSGPCDIVSKFARGYHKEGIRSGSAPEETIYWFKGALICLIADLSNNESLSKAIAQAVDYGRRSTRSIGEHFYAVLMSIRQVVLLRWSSKIFEATTAMPLLSVVGDDDSSFSGHWQKQTGSESDENSNIVEDCESLEAMEERDSTFYALMHLFEASGRVNLKQKDEGGVLPTEMYREIFKYIDCETQRACLEVSRKFRALSRERMFITRDLLLETYDSNSDEFLFRNSSGGECISANPHYKTRSNIASQDFMITYGHELRTLKDIKAPRLSFIGTCHLGGYRDEVRWQKSLEQPKLNSPVRVEGGEPRTLTSAPPHSAHHSWQYWNNAEIRSLSQRHGSAEASFQRFNYSGTMPIFSLYIMWERILRFHLFNPCAESDYCLQRPAYTRAIDCHVYCTAESSISGVNQRIMKQELHLHAQLGRPDAFGDRDFTFNRLFERAQVEVQQKSQRANWRNIFVLLGVGHYVEFYQFNNSQKRLLPYAGTEATKRLHIFRPGDRELVETFFTHVRRSENKIRRYMQASGVGGYYQHY